MVFQALTTRRTLQLPQATRSSLLTGLMAHMQGCCLYTRSIPREVCTVPTSLKPCSLCYRLLSERIPVGLPCKFITQVAVCRMACAMLGGNSPCDRQKYLNRFPGAVMQFVQVYYRISVACKEAWEASHIKWKTWQNVSREGNISHAGITVHISRSLIDGRLGIQAAIMARAI